MAATAPRIQLDEATVAWHKQEILKPSGKAVYVDWLYSKYGANAISQNAYAAYPQSYEEAIALTNPVSNTNPLPKNSVYNKAAYEKIGAHILEAVTNGTPAERQRHHALVLQADGSKFPNGSSPAALAELAASEQKACLSAGPDNAVPRWPNQGAAAAAQPTPYKHPDFYGYIFRAERTLPQSPEQFRIPGCYFTNYLEARVRNARGYKWLGLINNGSQAGDAKVKDYAAHIEAALAEEGISFKPLPVVHKEPGAGVDHDSVFYVCGKAGPFVENSAGVFQAQKGYFMRLGHKAGSKNSQEARKFWISNKEPPKGSRSAWIPSATGKIEEVWFSDAVNELEEEQRASSENRPIHQIFADIKPWEIYTDGKHQSQANPLFEPVAATVLVDGVETTSKTYAEIGAHYYPTVQPIGDGLYGESGDYSGYSDAGYSGDYSDVGYSGDYSDEGYSGDYSDDYSQ